jgi:hypothetical protein
MSIGQRTFDGWDQRFHRRGVGEVARRRMHSVSSAAASRSSASRRVPVSATEAPARAGRAQCLPKSARRASDERNSSCQIEHQGRPFRRILQGFPEALKAAMSAARQC